MVDLMGVQERAHQEERADISEGVCRDVSFCWRAGLGCSYNTFSCRNDSSTMVFPYSERQDIESVQFCQ